jgi:hypothetical protein
VLSKTIPPHSLLLVRIQQDVLFVSLFQLLDVLPQVGLEWLELHVGRIVGELLGLVGQVRRPLEAAVAACEDFGIGELEGLLDRLDIANQQVLVAET